MSTVLENFTYDLSDTQAKTLLGIQPRALVLLGRLRVLNDGSVEVEDEWAGSALDALSQTIRSSLPKSAIGEVEKRSGMPWSVFVGQCLVWWEGSSQPQRGGSMCMPRGLTPPAEEESKPCVKCASQNSSPTEEGPLQTAVLAGNQGGLSVWQPSNTRDLPSKAKHPRLPTPILPFLVILIERIGSLDLFFKGLKWNQNRRVPLLREASPIWPIVAGVLGAIILSKQSWWAPWPIMAFFGAGFGWLLSQSLGRKRYCGGIACKQHVTLNAKSCPRCGGDLTR